MKWIIEDDRFDEGNPNKFVEILESMDEDVMMIPYVPFGGNDFSFLKNEKVLTFGSINLMKEMEKQLGYMPGYCTWDNLGYSGFLPYYKRHLLNHNCNIITLGEFLQYSDQFFEENNTHSLFIRPNDVDKKFSGRVFWKESVNNVFNLMIEQGEISKKDLIVFAVSQEIRDEYRFVVSHGKVITGSRYHDSDGNLCSYKHVHPEAEKLALQIANETWIPDPIFIVDICRHELEYKVLELGSVNCAGLYQCDIEQIIKEFKRIYERN